MENLKDNELSTLWIYDPAKSNLINEIDLTNFKYIKNENLIEFKENGFTIIKSAISHKRIDNLLKILDDEKKMNKNNDFFCSYGLNIKKLKHLNMDIPLTKLLDLHVKINDAKKLLSHNSIKEFLQIMYGEPGKLIQSLYFKKGSTQAIHQDCTYAVITPHPHNLIAVWIALEDVKEGSGELIYLPGSHKKLIFRYGDGRIHFDNTKDTNELHHHHLHVLKEMTKEINTLHFFPKKGDILFWHAGLAHGGSEITNNNLTRKSVVGHYCPNSENPYYYNFNNNVFMSEYNGLTLMSMYYNN